MSDRLSLLAPLAGLQQAHQEDVLETDIQDDLDAEQESFVALDRQTLEGLGTGEYLHSKIFSTVAAASKGVTEGTEYTYHL